MKLPDANLLLYAYDTGSAHHRRARRWLEEVLSGTETVALAWVAVLAFVRLSTSPRIFARALTVDEALDCLTSWLAQPVVAIVHPTDRHPMILRELLRSAGTGGNLTSDAHLAALAIEHRAELCSADRDFGRFPGLSFVNPLPD